MCIRDSHEIETMLPTMLAAKRIIQKKHPGITWHLRIAPGLDANFIRAHCEEDIRLDTELPRADLAIVKSGTSSFEMAVLGIPEIICYSTSGLNYLIAKTFVKVDHIGMPNIILARPAVPELIQEALTSEAIAREAFHLIEDKERFIRMQEDFRELRSRLGTNKPSERVAAWIQDMIA